MRRFRTPAVLRAMRVSRRALDLGVFAQPPLPIERKGAVFASQLGGFAENPNAVRMERDMQPLSTDVSAQAVWWPLCATKMTQPIGVLNMSRYHRNISAGQFSHRISRLLTTTAVAILATSLPHTAFAQQQPEFTDLGMSTAETPAIKNMAAQGVITAAAPGKFDPAAPMKRGDFAIALQRLFNLPQPRNPVKFSDVHPTDALYPAVEAVEPYMDKQVPCPGCDIGTKFSPEKQCRERNRLLLWFVF